MIRVVDDRDLDRAEHERQFDAARKLGPQAPGSLSYADVLPPLTFSRERIRAEIAIARCGHDSWDDMPAAEADPRTPWGSVPVIHVRRVDRDHHIVIEPYGLWRAHTGWRATLWSDDTGSTHTLIHGARSRAVRFDDAYSAQHLLQSTADAGGVPPRGWSWNPDPGLASRWKPVGKPGGNQVAWRGLHRWSIWNMPGGVVIDRDGAGHRVLDSSGRPRCYSSVEAARRYCELEDQR